MRTAFVFAAVLAVTHAAAQRVAAQPARPRDSVTTPARAETTPPVLRGLYVNRSAAQSKPRMRALIALAKETGLNTLVIDLKDEFGLNFRPTDSAVRPLAGRAGAIPDVRWLVDTLKANGLVPVARMVVFKDSVAARAHPEWTIRAPDGQPWRDKQQLTWVNPYNRELWNYLLRAAEEVARFGFAEIQFDYIRFPEPFPSLPKQTFPGANGVGKPELLAEFLKAAKARLAPLGARTTADVFGLVTSVKGTLEVGQQWEIIARAVDVMLPMVYPSHYVSGSFGIARPNGAPYEVIKAAVSRAVERNTAIGLGGERVRPYLQAFTLGKPAYGNEQLTAQLRAVYDTGMNGWILWNPGSRYEQYRGALMDDAAKRANVRR